MGVWARFRADQRGATAIMFGLSVLPIMGLMGAAVDYSRAAAVQTEVQRAVDATALALVRESASSSPAAFSAQAQALFNTLYRAPGYVAMKSVTATRSGKTIKVAAAGTMTNAFMQVAGLRDTAVGATSTSVSGTQKIELALVLDNTGSMGDWIGGQRKIDALKDQAKKLLGQLRGATTDVDSVKVSIVPFDTEVRLDADQYRYKSTWFRGWSGNAYRRWTGYVFDRYNDYATSDDAPTPSIPDSLFPAPLTSERPSDLATMRPLTSLYAKADYDALTAVVDGMQPRGNTNIALGTIWGLATLSPGEPFTEAAAFSDASVKKFLVVLTDGTNTEYHKRGQPSGSVADIDANTRAACTAVKAKKIEVFTIRLLDGNAGLLQSCATDADHYADVKSAADLSNAFAAITNAVIGTRLTH